MTAEQIRSIPYPYALADRDDLRRVWNLALDAAAKVVEGDSTPVTPAWLSEVFEKLPDGNGTGAQLDEDPCDEDCEWRAIVASLSGATLVNLNNPDRCYMRLCQWKTRGDVRQLCQVLGVSLKEPTHAD
jgi:hypothetical protein